MYKIVTTMLIIFLTSPLYPKTKQDTRQSFTLNNTNWKVISIKDQLVPSSIKIDIHFGNITDSKSKVYGNSGCNKFTGEYYITRSNGENILGFSQFASTRMMCINKKASKMEQLFLETIPFVQSFISYKNKLHLQSINHKIILVLEEVEGFKTI